MREYIKAARDEAKKSRCDRAHVGCVIVDRASGQVVSRAFNETPPGLEPTQVATDWWTATVSTLCTRNGVPFAR